MSLAEIAHVVIGASAGTALTFTYCQWRMTVVTDRWEAARHRDFVESKIRECELRDRIAELLSSR